MLLNKQQQEIIHHIVEEEKAYKFFSKWDYTGDILKGIRKDIDKLCEKWEDDVCSDVINSLRSVKLEDLV